MHKYKYIYAVLVLILTVTTSVDIVGQDTSPPTAPGNVRVDLAGTRFVRLAWDAATDDSGAVTYEVEEVDAMTSYSVSDTEWTSPVANLAPESSTDFRVRAVDAAGNTSAWQAVTAETAAEVDGTGYLLGQIFDGIPGTDVASVIDSDDFFFKTPTRAVYLNGLDFNAFGDEYGILITGVLTAPKTGEFDFFIRSDDASQFFLNEDGPEIPQPDTDFWIAEETGCCNAFQEVGASQTTQVPISLTEGSEYGFAFIVSEGGGGDWGQVAMREVGDTTPAAELQPIRGSILSSKIDPVGAEISITQHPQDTVGEEGSFVALIAQAEVRSPYGLKPLFQWNKDGEPIPGATTDTLFLRNLTAADAGDYSVTLVTMGQEVTSDPGTLTIVPQGQLPSGGSGSQTVRVSNGLDDAEEHPTEGNSIDLTSSDLELGAEGGGTDLQDIGIRFQNLIIPARATITKATIQFTVDEADDEPTSLWIYGELTTDPAQYSNAVGDISSRTKTTAFVEWNDIPVWDADSIGTAGPDQLTPDLSPIVQEIVSQEDWAGGAMAFIIVPNPEVETPGGERTVESFNGSEGSAPLLHVEYTVEGGGGGDPGGGDGGSATVSIAHSESGVTLTFEGTLQESDSVNGPYTDVAGATSPMAIPASGSGKFFRATE